MTYSKSFQYFGVNLKSYRGVWSGASSDGKMVVVALWDDLLHNNDGIISYDDTDRLNGSASRGAALRLEHLNYAQETGAIVKIVRVFAKDTNARPRAIARSCPETKDTLRITKINQYTGAFRGECVPADKVSNEANKAKNFSECVC